MTDPLLQVDDLAVSFQTDEGTVRAVRGVSFEVAKGETVGIVGESGSGKSVTNLAIMGLVPMPPGSIDGGSARFDGVDLLKASDQEIRRLRGRRISMIFQDPMTALNPLMTVEQQLTEGPRMHLGMNRAEAKRRAAEMLGLVGISSPEKRMRSYPHEFSGGMRQRVMIAMALACEPDLLIADEPTTALDVTIQAQILDLLADIQKERGTSIIFITHDLGVVAGYCDRVMVMYAGRIVEKADTETLFSNPQHPYTHGLLESLPRFDEGHDEQLVAIPGQPPDMTNVPDGCSFLPRCPFAEDKCRHTDPDLQPKQQDALVACVVNLENATRKPALVELDQDTDQVSQA